MAGKYAQLLPKLPRLTSPDAPFQERVQAMKQLILDDTNASVLTSSELARAYREVRDELDRLDEATSRANLRLEAIKQMLVSQYEAEDIASVQLSDGATVRVQPEPYAQVKDKQAFRKWCIANGLEESLALPWLSTNSITKERLLAGLPEPDGVEACKIDKVVLRR